MINRDNKNYNHVFTILTFGRYKEFIHHGAFGTGKTYSICEALGLHCKMLMDLGITGLNIVLAGKTQGAVKKNMGNTLTKLFSDNFKYTKSTKDGFAKDAVLFGQNILIVGMNDNSAESKFRGLTDVYCIVHDECTLCDQDQHNYMMGRLRGEFKGINFPSWIKPCFFVGSCNPDVPNHFIKKMIDEGTPSLSWGMKDAVWNGAKEYYENLKRKYKNNQMFYDRYLLGKWTTVEGLVYKSFNYKKHILDSEYSIDYRNVDRLILGVDYGGNHPTALCLVAVTDKTYIVVKTKYLRDTAPSSIVDEICRWLNDCKEQGKEISALYIDPSAKGLKDELTKRQVSYIHGKNEHSGGIGCIDSLFSLDLLYILCGNDDLVNEILKYKYKENSLKEEVIKIDDDLCDAMRYAIYTDWLSHDTRGRFNGVQ